MGNHEFDICSVASTNSSFKPYDIFSDFGVLNDTWLSDDEMRLARPHWVDNVYDFEWSHDLCPKDTRRLSKARRNQIEEWQKELAESYLPLNSDIDQNPLEDGADPVTSAPVESTDDLTEVVTPREPEHQLSGKSKKQRRRRNKKKKMPKEPTLLGPEAQQPQLALPTPTTSTTGSTQNQVSSSASPTISPQSSPSPLLLEPEAPQSQLAQPTPTSSITGSSPASDVEALSNPYHETNHFTFDVLLCLIGTIVLLGRELHQFICFLECAWSANGKLSVTDIVQMPTDILDALVAYWFISWDWCVKFANTTSVRKPNESLPSHCRVRPRATPLKYNWQLNDKPPQGMRACEYNGWFRKRCINSGLLGWIWDEYPGELLENLYHIAAQHGARDWTENMTPAVARCEKGRALLICFEQINPHKELDFEQEVKDLEKAIRRYLGYSVELCIVPLDQSEEYLADRIRQFIENSHPGEQLLIHFGGHGRQDETTKELMIRSHSNERSEVNMSTLINDIVMSSKQDVALLLDCCYSGAILRGANGARIEVLTAGNLTKVDGGVHSKKSMTAFFIKFLEKAPGDFSLKWMHRKLLLLHSALEKTHSEPQWQVLSGFDKPRIVFHLHSVPKTSSILSGLSSMLSGFFSSAWVSVHALRDIDCWQRDPLEDRSDGMTGVC